MLRAYDRHWIFLSVEIFRIPNITLFVTVILKYSFNGQRYQYMRTEIYLFLSLQKIFLNFGI